MSDIYDAGDLEYNSDDENNAYDDQDDDIVQVDAMLFDDTSAPLTHDDRLKLQGYVDPNPLTSPPEDESDIVNRKKR